MEKKILIADDEKNMRWVLGEALTAAGYEVIEAKDGKEALKAATGQSPDLMILDNKMPAPNGLEVLKQLRAKDYTFPIIMLTAFGNVDGAVEAMKAGATEYVTKPFDLDELKIAIDKAMRVADLTEEVTRLREEIEGEFDIEGIVAADPKMLDVIDTVQQVAPADATVMISGESGTGKELVARALHRLSPRGAKRFVEVHAGALPETLLESELFGYEKGAFTGATMAKPGRFELANGGTIFLDEVGDITPAVQVKLLRVLQEKTFERLGGTKTIEVDVRVIAASNQDLQQRIKDGTFREDLFYRLNVVPIWLPPLRDRAEDIPLLVAHFLEKYEAGERTIDSEAMGLLMQYAWPGNVRELENTIERILILSQNDEIGVAELPGEVRVGVKGSTIESTTFQLPEDGVDFDSVEFDLVKQALDRSEGDIQKAAALLGLTSDRFEARMERFGLT